MNESERNYLRLSLHTLHEILPAAPEDFLSAYAADPSRWNVETISGLVFCLFSFPVLPEADRVILLVYDKENRIIADAGAYHMSVKTLLESRAVYDYLSEESDWMYLSHYVLCSCLFPAYPYPFCEQDAPAEEEGEVLVYTNAYVSAAFRRQGIFRNMLETMSEHALRGRVGIQTVCSVLSMDPDIACYGPDTRDEPYYYSFEKDEPVRLQNAEIARRIGFVPLRLEPDHPEEETDGTKLWFCVRREVFETVETVL